MERAVAVKIMQKHITKKNLQKHCLAVEAVMEKLAEHLGEDKYRWAMVGLLHDIDYEETIDDSARHGIVGAEMLADMGFPIEIAQAVAAHNSMHGMEKKKLIDKALYAADPLTGLIVAGALIKPEKKLSAIDVDFLLNRFNEKSFARGANRKQVAACVEFGLSLEEFMGIGLSAMQGISKELGL